MSKLTDGNWAQPFLYAVKRIKTAEACLTLHLWNDARAALTSCGELLKEIESTSLLMEAEATRLKYEQNGMNVNVQPLDNNGAMGVAFKPRPVLKPGAHCLGTDCTLCIGINSTRPEGCPKGLTLSQTCRYCGEMEGWQHFATCPLYTQA